MSNGKDMEKIVREVLSELNFFGAKIVVKNNRTKQQINKVWKKVSQPDCVY